MEALLHQVLFLLVPRAMLHVSSQALTGIKPACRLQDQAHGGRGRCFEVASSSQVC